MRSRMSRTAAMPARLIPKSRLKRTMRCRRCKDDRENSGPDPIVTFGSIKPKPTNCSTRLGCKETALARSSTESSAYAAREGMTRWDFSTIGSLAFELFICRSNCRSVFRFEWFSDS
jgi:hypothetical protein